MCICCRKVFEIDDDSVFCPECYEAMRARVIDKLYPIKSEYVDKCYIYYKYKSWYVKKIIAHTKYTCSKEYLDLIGKLGKESLKGHNLADVLDVVTFSPRRVLQRNLYSFDQAEELAKAIAKELGIPCEALVKRRGISFAQKKLGAEGRSKNVVGKFACNEDVTGKSILLIDDVVTTGSTVSECAKVLKKQGAKAVYVWALA